MPTGRRQKQANTTITGNETQPSKPKKPGNSGAQVVPREYQASAAYPNRHAAPLISTILFGPGVVAGKRCITAILRAGVRLRVAFEFRFAAKIYRKVPMSPDGTE